MSHILDALRKSEQERDVGNATRLAMIDNYPVRPRRRWDVWIATALIIVNGMALALLLEGRPATTAEVPDASKENRESASAEVREVTGKTLLDHAAHDTREPGEAVFSDAGLDIEEVQRIDQERRHQRLLLRDNHANGVRALVRESHWNIADTAQPKVSEASAVASVSTGLQHASITAPAPSVALEPLSDSTTVALLDEMDQQFQQSLPALSLDVHVYAEREQDRFVLINQKKYHIGERTLSGAVVEAIRVDGVVLVYAGRRFRLIPN